VAAVDVVAIASCVRAVHVKRDPASAETCSTMNRPRERFRFGVAIVCRIE